MNLNELVQLAKSVKPSEDNPMSVENQWGDKFLVWIDEEGAVCIVQLLEVA